MNNTREHTRPSIQGSILAKLVMTTSGILVASSLFAIVSKQGGQYDPQESVTKLKKIGAALKIYRSEYCLTPAEQWQSPSDAGLPPNMTVLAEPGHPWSLTEGAQAFKLTGTLILGMGTSDFLHNYPPCGIAFGTGSVFDGFSAILKDRGTKMPVLSDPHYAMLPEFDSDRGWNHDIVLRMDGTVEVVRFKSGGVLNILKK